MCEVPPCQSKRRLAGSTVFMTDKSRIIGVLAVLVTVGSLITIFYNQFDRRPKVDVAPFEALGSAVAEETAKLSGPSGRVVLLIVDTAKYKIPTLDTLVTSFRKTLEKRGHATITAMEKFRVPPATFMALSAGTLVPPSAGLSPEQFAKVLAAHGNADVIVSFVGVPPLSAESIGELKAKRIRIVVVSDREPWLLDLLQAGAIHLAVVPRAQPTSQSGKKDGAGRNWFNDNYELLVPEK